MISEPVVIKAKNSLLKISFYREKLRLKENCRSSPRRTYGPLISLQPGCRYLSREELEKRGLSKLVQQADARMAALAAGTDNRPVTTREIQAHLDDFALAKEFSVYGKIGGLSGGQKVTVDWLLRDFSWGMISCCLALMRYDWSLYP